MKWRVEIREPAYAQHDSPGNVVHAEDIEAYNAAGALSVVAAAFADSIRQPFARGLDICVFPAPLE